MKTIVVVLTGGMSRRMGKDKGSIVFEGGETMLSLLVNRYWGVFDGVYVSVNQAGRFPTRRAFELVDIRPSAGPMAGLEAAFVQTDAELVILTAVDLPFGSTDLMQRLIELKGDAAACFIRRKDGRPEPLFAVYDRSCLGALQQCLDADEHSFRSLFEKVNVRQVQEEELAQFPLDRLLLNVNRPEDLSVALKARRKSNIE